MTVVPVNITYQSRALNDTYDRLTHAAPLDQPVDYTLNMNRLYGEPWDRVRFTSETARIGQYLLI